MSCVQRHSLLLLLLRYVFLSFFSLFPIISMSMQVVVGSVLIFPLFPFFLLLLGLLGVQFVLPWLAVLKLGQLALQFPSFSRI